MSPEVTPYIWLLVFGSFFAIHFFRRIRNRPRPGVPTRNRIQLLQPCDESVDSDPDAATAIIQSLLHLGFEPAGRYSLDPDGLKVAAYVHRDARVYAGVNHTDSQNVQLHLFCEYTNGSTQNYTSADGARTALWWPSHTSKAYPGMDVARLWVRMMRDRPAADLVSVAPEGLLRSWNRHNAKIHAWSASQWASNETSYSIYWDRLLSKKAGQTKADVSEAIRTKLERISLLYLSGYLLDQFSIESGWPLAAAEFRSRCVVINDLMRDDDAVEAALGWRSWFNRDLQATLARPGDASPRQMFRLANSMLPEHKRWRKLGEVNDPVPADIYCR